MMRFDVSATQPGPDDVEDEIDFCVDPGIREKFHRHGVVLLESKADNVAI